MSEIRAAHVATADAEIAYREAGPADGTPIVFLHGFPDDALTWDRIAPALAADGFRTIAPYLRGFGPTRLRPGIPRTGEIAALAADLLALLDALGIARAHLVGHDWGARAAYALASIAPERAITLSALAVAYGTNVASQAMPLDQVRAYWYQWYFATPRGAAHLERERAAFARELWHVWSPHWRIDEAEFAETAASFENPDFIDVVLTSYRQRWDFIEGDPRYAELRARIGALAPIEVPTVAIMGADDGATLPSSAVGREALFRGPYRVLTVPGSGHFLQREAPDAVLAVLRDHVRR